MNIDDPPSLDFGLELQLPPSNSTSSQSNLDYLTISGTLHFDNIAVGRQGVRAQEPQESSSSSIRLSDLVSLQVLGKGASATVQLVEHKPTGQLYALKDIQMSMDAESRRMIGNELRINYTCRSPFLVRCFEAFLVDGRVSIVLEYMDAGSLADVLRSVGRLTEPFLAAISRQALQGLKELHSNFRIIHRDIKPSNLLLNQSGQLKISDFGVSRVLENSYDAGNTFAGTCTYMSPERIRGQRYSYNSDIWAFGLSLLECATGRYPYHPTTGEQAFSSYFQLLSDVTNSPAPIAPPEHFSPEFCHFISQCLQTDPALRASAEQLLDHPFLKLYDDISLAPLAGGE